MSNKTRVNTTMISPFEYTLIVDVQQNKGKNNTGSLTLNLKIIVDVQQNKGKHNTGFGNHGILNTLIPTLQLRMLL